MIFPKCATGVPSTVSFLVVATASSTCFWEGTCRPPLVSGGRGCINTTAITAIAPSEWIKIAVSNASRATVYGEDCH